jgi:DNA-binding HxlR family transcriptional regulator
MQSTDVLNDLIMLSKGRWLAPLIADLAMHEGGRFVELSRRLNLSGESLTRTLSAGMSTGLIMRNPGYGHPLRPEYVLTGEGARIAAIAQAQLAAQTQVSLAPGALTRWGLPIVHLIGTGLNRFNDLSRALMTATPRALSQGLQTLGSHELVERRLVDSYPPASRYDLTAAGSILARALP